MNIQYKQILAVFMGLGALSAFPIYHVFKGKFEPKIAVFGSPSQEQIADSVSKISQEGSTVADTLVQELNQENERLLQNIQKAFNIAPQEWADAYQKFVDFKKNDHLFVKNPQVTNNSNDHELVKKARQILANNGIDPNCVKIYTYENPDIMTNAIAEQGHTKESVLHRLAINIPRLSSHSLEIQQAILNHETRHLVYYDPLELGCIQEILEQKGVQEKDYLHHPAYVALSKHKEFRADLTAACQDIQMCQAFKQNFENSIKEYPQMQDDPTRWISHPSSKQRYAAMNRLDTYMQAEQQLANA